MNELIAWKLWQRNYKLGWHESPARRQVADYFLYCRLKASGKPLKAALVYCFVRLFGRKYANYLENKVN